MARPIKQGLTYFPLDVDFLDDVKVFRIRNGQGPSAVAVLIALLENIYKDHGYYMEWGEDVSAFISQKTGVSEGAVSAVVEKAVNVGFFDKPMKDKYGILTSRGIQKRYRMVAKRRLSEIEDKYALISVSVTETPVNATETPVNVTVMQQRKEKERKEKERKGAPALPPAVGGQLEAALIALTGGANLTQLSSLSSLVQRHGEENVLDALRIAGERGIRKLSYVEGILKDWAANGRDEPKRQTARHAEPSRTPRVFSQQAQDEEAERAREAILKSMKK